MEPSGMCSRVGVGETPANTKVLSSSKLSYLPLHITLGWVDIAEVESLTSMFKLILFCFFTYIKALILVK